MTSEKKKGAHRYKDLQANRYNRDWQGHTRLSYKPYKAMLPQDWNINAIHTKDNVRHALCYAYGHYNTHLSIELIRSIG